VLLQEHDVQHLFQLAFIITVYYTYAASALAKGICSLVYMALLIVLLQGAQHYSAPLPTIIILALIINVPGYVAVALARIINPWVGAARRAAQ
jgi:hypothetical protein